MSGAQGAETVDLQEFSIMTGFMSLLPAATTLIASNLAALRAHRDGADELYGVAPAPAVARTGGHLLALAWPAVVSLVGPGSALAMAYVRAEPFGALELAEVAVGPLLVAGAGALGVLLARWLPTTVAVPLACVAIAVFELAWNGDFVADSGWRWMAFWLQAAGEFPADLLPGRPAGWHAVYLTSLIAAAAVGALLRHGLTRHVGVVGAVVLSVAAVSAWAKGRPRRPRTGRRPTPASPTLQPTGYAISARACATAPIPATARSSTTGPRTSPACCDGYLRRRARASWR